MAGARAGWSHEDKGRWIHGHWVLCLHAEGGLKALERSICLAWGDTSPLAELVRMGVLESCWTEYQLSAKPLPSPAQPASPPPAPKSQSAFLPGWRRREEGELGEWGRGWGRQGQGRGETWRSKWAWDWRGSKSGYFSSEVILTCDPCWVKWRSVGGVGGGGRSHKWSP